MTDAAHDAALARWGLTGCASSLIAARENHVFRIEAPQGRLALRLHRPGLRSRAQLLSELDWMGALAVGGLAVPRPVPARDGRLIHTIGQTLVDVLTWVAGDPMGQDGRLTVTANPSAAYHALGGRMADLHRLSDAWTRPATFTRPAWDAEGLVGERPLWGRFWENPLLSAGQASLLSSARSLAKRRLAELGREADYGLIHADLVPENVLLGLGGPVLIDFDDGGDGFRLFDLATVLNRTLREDDASILTEAFLSGYQSARPTDLQALPLFQALRSFTYVGWIVPRLSERGAEARARRFITLACTMAENLLAEQT